MCGLCKALNPTEETYDFHGLKNFSGEGSSASTSKPVYSIDQVADYLTEGYWKDSGSSAHSFDVKTGGTITYNVSGLTATGAATAKQALAAWTAVSGLNFKDVGTETSAQIIFDDNNSGAYAWSSYWRGEISKSHINIDTAWAKYGGYYFQTYMHEIGHALGLGHAGHYNGSGSYGTDAHFANDSWQTTVMSYFSQNANSWTKASYAYLATLQLGDIAAIQKLYGTPTNIETGDTIYGEGETTGRFGMDLSGRFAVAIVDNGGTDLINLAQSTRNQSISLVAETYSSINGKTGNFSIGRNTVIENATTGAGKDHIIGNAVANRLESGAGDDIIQAGGGNDTLIGGAGADTLTGGEGADSFVYVGLSDGGDTITDFNLAAGDRVDLTALLKSLNYTGSDPVADGLVFLQASGSGSWLSVKTGTTETKLTYLAGVAATADVNDIIGIAAVTPPPPPPVEPTPVEPTPPTDPAPVAEVMTFTAETVSGYASHQDQGIATISKDGTALTLTKNAWKQVMRDVTVTEDTVLSFDFSSTREGEIHGIGFERDGQLSLDWIFQLDGTQAAGIQTYSGLYSSGSGTTKSYKINVGKHFTGTFDRIIFVMDDDTNVGGDSTFGAVTLSQAEPKDPTSTDVMTFGPTNVQSYAGSQDQGVATISQDGTALTLTQNAWKQVMTDVTVTKDTILSFDFSSNREGEIHGIGFERDGQLSLNWIFQLDGTQAAGIQSYNGLYSSGSGTTKSYKINVGQHFTGDFDRVVFVMDDDTNVGGDSTFSAVKISQTATEEPVTDVNVMKFTTDSVSSYAAEQDQGVATISQDGTALTLTKNAWKQVMKDVSVTANTVLSFEFSSSREGEIHGIGFERDGHLNLDWLFQLDGTQAAGIQAYNGLYSSGSGTTKSYKINVGQHFTGDFDRIVFVMDDDTNVGGDSTFADIALF